jgi:L-ascorbate metabolism protein UlaG (beta-lactamase superfamily)
MKVASATRSGLRRYPRAIFDSVCKPFARGLLRHPHRLPEMAHLPLGAVWLGHASVFVRLAGVNILVDPVFSDRIGVTVGQMTFGLPRLAPLPIDPAHLPPIDLILISHAHFDHLDRPTLQGLASHSTTVVTARRTRRLIPSGFARIIELDWDHNLHFKGLDISAIQPAHWGARTAVDRRRGYNSYIVREKHDRQGVLLAGDTALTDAFEDLEEVALAVLGIGAYEPWEHAHATPEQVWQMFTGSGAANLLPVHHSTFPLGDEHIDEPMERLLAAAGPERAKVIRAKQGDVWAA